MQPDVILAQAATLREWSDQWQRDAQPGDGTGEVAFRLRNAAAMIEAVARGLAEPVAPDLPPVAEPVADVREG